MSESKEQYGGIDSDEYLTDEGKRKKEDIEDLYKRSKKTHKTPNKGCDSKDSMGEQMREIMNLLRDLSGDVKEIKGEQRTNTEELKALQEEIRTMRTEQSEFKEEIEKMKDINSKAMKEIDDLKKEVKIANERIEKLEGEKRRKNIIIQGMKINASNPRTLKEGVEKFIEKELGATIKVESARKLGTKTCLVELNSRSDKTVIMSNKSKLRNHGEEIYINDDLTKEERQVQARIREIAREESAKGKIVKIGFRKITIGEETWTWNGEAQKLEISSRQRSKAAQGVAKN